MSRGAVEFERLWSRIEETGEVAINDPRVTGKHRAALSLALALRDAGRPHTPLDLDATWEQIAGELHEPDRPVVRLRPVRHWPARIALGAAAALLFVMISLRSEPGSLLYPVRTSMERTALLLLPNRASLHLHIAEARLDDLLHVLNDGPAGAAPGLARALVDDRAAAEDAGANCDSLDQRIALEVPPALASAPSSIASEVRAALGDLLPEAARPSTSRSSAGGSARALPRSEPGPASRTAGARSPDATRSSGGRPPREGSSGQPGDGDESGEQSRSAGGGDGGSGSGESGDPGTNQGSDSGSDQGSGSDQNSGSDPQSGSDQGSGNNQDSGSGDGGSGSSDGSQNSDGSGDGSQNSDGSGSDGGSDSSWSGNASSGETGN